MMMLIMQEVSGSLGPLEDLDRLIVAAIAVNGRASWGQLGQAVGVSESTAARRAGRLFAAGVVGVVGMPDPLVCGFGQPVLIHLKCVPGQVREVASQLARRPDARLVVLTAGTWDIVVELISAGRDNLAGVLIDEIQRMDGVRETSTEMVLRTFKLTFDWARDTLGDGVAAVQPPAPTPPDTPVRLDETDLALMAELADDGRRSYAELAPALGISESQVARRMTRLTESGCIGFVAMVDPQLLGFEVEALLRLQVELPRLEEAAAILCAQTGARYVSMTTGDADLVCEVVLPDSTALYRFITETLSALPGLRSVDTSPELRTIKRAYRSRRVSTAATENGVNR